MLVSWTRRLAFGALLVVACHGNERRSRGSVNSLDVTPATPHATTGAPNLVSALAVSFTPAAPAPTAARAAPVTTAVPVATAAPAAPAA
ncbi:MAG: hypothetical protein Q8S73_42280, partial [Deltaproteobacteria bacterium]|nr:hypothetical protein [Deltaproteobacteria bacterium]